MFDQLSTFGKSISDALKHRISQDRKMDRQDPEAEQDPETEEDINEEDRSLKNINKGNHGNIRGFRRKYIKGVAVGIGVLFATAATYVAISSAPSDNQQTQTIKETASASKQPSDASALPSKYAELGALAKKDQQQNLPETVPPQQLPSASVTQLPAIPQAAVPAIVGKTPEELELEQRIKSAISFGIEYNGPAGSGAASGSVSAVNVPNIAYNAPGENTLLAGTYIPAVLMTGINSDASGQISAQILTDVYDSVYGESLLLPSGSRLLGTYQGSDSTNGRVNIDFTTVILPDGGSYSLGGSLAAVDQQGYMGIKGKVDRHSEAVLGKAIVAETIDALTTRASNSRWNIFNTVSDVYARNSSMTPTVTVEPGTSFNLYVTSSLTLNPYRGE